MWPTTQSGILVHQQKLNDPSVKWAGAYKTLLWTLILPSGPKNPNRPEIEVFGALQHCRRTVLTWLRERATKAELHAVMDATIAGASTGARGTSHTSPTWSFVFG